MDRAAYFTSRLPAAADSFTQERAAVANRIARYNTAPTAQTTPASLGDFERLPEELRAKITAMSGPTVRNDLRLVSQALHALSDRQVTSLGAKTWRGIALIAQKLAAGRYPLLRSLDLSRHKGTPDMQVLSALLRNPLCEVTSVYLGHNSFHNGGLKILFTALSECKLQSLDLREMEIDGGELQAADEVDDEVEEDEGDMPIDHEVVKDLIAAMSNSDCGLTSLTLDSSVLARDSRRALFEALRDPKCKLTSLALPRGNPSEGGIDASDAQALAKVLCDTNFKLTSLDLSDNDEITEAAMLAVVNALSDSNCDITSLKLSGIPLSDQVIRALAGALVNSNCGLTELYIDGSLTALSDPVLSTLTSALSHENCKLSVLGVRECGLDDKAAQSLAGAARNSKLKEILASGNKIGNEGAKAFTTAMSDPSCPLEILDLYNNPIGNAHALELEAVRPDRTLVIFPRTA